MCPKGDDPVTINQDYRAIQMVLTTVTPAYLNPSGNLGIELYGKVAYIDLNNPHNCGYDLSFTGPFGEVSCSVVRSGDYGAILTFQMEFISWPSKITDNNLYYNDGNPSIEDFRCDISRVQNRISVCYFTDVYATNVKGKKSAGRLLFTYYINFLCCCSC